MIAPATPYIGEPASLPLHQIVTADQIRKRNGFDESSLRELADSIKTHGLLQPIIVHSTGAEEYTVIAGERRLLACTMAGLAEVPVLIRQVFDDAELDALQAVENLQRVDLSLLDQADGVAAMVARLGPKRTAAMLAKSPAWVSKRTSIAKLPDDIRALAANGDTEDVESLTMLAQIRRRDPAAFKSAANAVANGTATRASIKRVLDGLKASTKAEDQPEEGEGDEGEGDETPAKPSHTQPGPKPIRLTREELDWLTVQLRPMESPEAESIIAKLSAAI